MDKGEFYEDKRNNRKSDYRRRYLETASAVLFSDSAGHIFPAALRGLLVSLPPNTRIEACKTTKMYKRNDEITEKLYMVSEILK